LLDVRDNVVQSRLQTSRTIQYTDNLLVPRVDFRAADIPSEMMPFKHFGQIAAEQNFWCMFPNRPLIGPAAQKHLLARFCKCGDLLLFSELAEEIREWRESVTHSCAITAF